MYRRILVPTDGSEGSRAAVEHAIDLAKSFDAALHTLHVIDTDVVPDAEMVDVFDAFHEAGEQAVNSVVDEAEAAGLETVEASIAQGTAHQAILDYVENRDIDLVVMGTHGRTGLDRYLLGSVTEKVVRASDTPVLTIRRAGGA